MTDRAGGAPPEPRRRLFIRAPQDFLAGVTLVAIALFAIWGNAVFAPKATPKEIVAKLNDALVKALDDPTTRKRLGDLGGDIPDRAGRSPEALAKLVQGEVARWATVFKSIGGAK